MEDDGFAAKPEEYRRLDDERWRQQQTVLRRAAADLAHRRTESTPSATGRTDTCQDEAFELVSKSLDHPSAEVRNIAVRAFYDLNPDLAGSFLNKALMRGSLEERRNIGAALVGSGLADQAVDSLTGEGHENAYSAFSLLFLVAKAGEVGPLMRVIEDHPNMLLRLAVIKLLALSGEPKIATAFFGLAQRNSLPSEIRSAVREAIFQLGRETR